MAESNGELVDEIPTTKSEDRGDGERTEDYSKLLEYGLDKKVCGLLSISCGICNNAVFLLTF